MKLLLALFLFSHSAFAIDTGDGSDGVCTNASFIVNKRIYQCTSVTINAPLVLFKAVGGAQVVIKAQEEITITGTGSIDLSGGDGINGNASAQNGGLAGAGGSAGGNSIVGADGLNGSGIGSSRGIAGLFVSDASNSNGGGGGGGSFRTKAAVEPENGFNTGGVFLSKGSNGDIILTSGSQFDTNFSGGSGGAAGGGGVNSGTLFSGSSGGGGGGALHLVAGTDIIIDGDIISNGGKGGGIISTQSSGGGGGGSGGAIWIQAAGDLTVNGTITTAGGNGGITDYGTGPNTGQGGNGGKGGIRLDDSDGIIVAGPGVDAGFYQGTFVPTPISSGTSAINRQYASGVSCASVTLDDQEKSFNNLINLLLGLSIAGLAHYLVSKKSKV